MMPESSREDDLVEALSSAAQRLDSSSEGSEEKTLSLIVASAVDTVPGADHAGVFRLHSNGSLSSAASTSDVVGQVEQLQARYQEGPCVSALWEQHTVVVEALDKETYRWPRFAPAAVEAGVASMLSFQLFAREGTLGALNLYSGTRKSFGTESEVFGGLFATHAARALGEARNLAQLHQALATRDIIGQAKGMLMERFGISADDAFNLLVNSSQQTNLRLTAVAAWLTGAKRVEE